MADIHSLGSRARLAVRLAASRLRPGDEAGKAASYWGSLQDYHLSNDDAPRAIERSRWIADVIVPELSITSLLEVGTNSGRNLRFVHDAHPAMRLKGIDVNANAIAFARSRAPGITFEVADANRWSEPPNEWDAALTMSVLDHIPDDATEALAVNLARSCRHVIAVELWDGKHGTRDVYKYSRDTKALFERHGFATMRWERSPGQYNEETSLLWAYVGKRIAPC